MNATFNKFLTAPRYTLAHDLALLVLRVLTGVSFYLAGSGKVATPTSWMPETMGFPPLVQALVAWGELIGGILVMLGLLTRAGALTLLIIMTGAVCVHIFLFGDPFMNPAGGSWQLAALYGAISLVLLAAGPGRFSLDRLLFRSRGNE